jgi:outer membrane protein OmpA-like peptidoglycan-associated protein
MRLAFALIFLSVTSLGFAQNLTGIWSGRLAQEPGGMLLLYHFELHLQQKGNNVTGYSLVSNPDKPEIRAKIMLKGTYDGVFFTFRETEIAEQNTPATYYWCIKRGVLLFERKGEAHRLSGKWNADHCQAGEVVIERVQVSKLAKMFAKSDETGASPRELTKKETTVPKATKAETKTVVTPPKPAIIDFSAANQGGSVVLGQVQFEQSLAELLPEAYPQLDALAAHLLANPALLVEVGGHTDNVGSAYRNIQLSYQRAERVMLYLVRKGVTRSRIIPRGYGGGQPLVANDSDENRKKNRRVSFKWLTQKP